jgi:hypothetical protein
MEERRTQSRWATAPRLKLTAEGVLGELQTKAQNKACCPTLAACVVACGGQIA